MLYLLQWHDYYGDTFPNKESCYPTFPCFRRQVSETSMLSQKEEEAISVPAADASDGEASLPPIKTMFWMLTKFLLPLVLAQMIPALADQVSAIPVSQDK